MARDSATCCDLWAKFNHPNGEILRTAHWRVVVRPKQVTLGALVLISARHVEALSALAPAEAAELPQVAAALEARLRRTFAPDKINYLALMMVDPHLHFHVLPRYADDPRPGWPFPWPEKDPPPFPEDEVQRGAAALRQALSDAL